MANGRGVRQKERLSIMSSGQKWLIAGVAMVLLNMVLLIAFGDNGLVEMQRLREDERALTIENETLARENLRLFRTIDRLNRDAAYIESVARNELGMVRPDDAVLLPAARNGQEK
jgi:cell division protein FtsB